jgi:hypothetical protein
MAPSQASNAAPANHAERAHVTDRRGLQLRLNLVVTNYTRQGPRQNISPQIQPDAAGRRYGTFQTEIEN